MAPSSLPHAGEIAALTTAVCWSLTPIFFSYSGRRIGSRIVNRSRLLLAVVWLMLAHLWLLGTPFPVDAGAYRWFWLGVSSLLGLVIGDSALFQAFVLIGPRLSMLVMSLVPILSTILAWLLLGETVSASQAAGIALTVGGVVWVVAEQPAERTVVPDPALYRRGLALALVGALGQAANLIAARFALVGGFPTVSASLIRILLAAVVMWALAAWRREGRETFAAWRDRRALAALTAGSIVGPFLGIWMSMVAIQNTEIGVASTLMALPPILLIPLGFVLYGERVSARAVVGTGAAMAGVALIFLPQ